MKRSIIAFTFILIGLHSFSQEDSTKKKAGVHAKLGLNYISSLNYYGRTDSLKSAGFFPMAELWLGKDVYINAAPVFVLANGHSDYAGTVSTAGYLHVTKHWISHVYVTKPFYEESSRLVQSALKAQTGTSFSYLNKILNLNAGADLKFSNQTDVGVSGGVDHLFKKVMNKFVLVVDPSIYTYAGSQRFTQKGQRTKPGSVLQPATTETYQKEISRFSILSYEASMPVVLVRGKWMAIANPAFVMPQNLINDASTVSGKESGSNLFYFSLSVKRTF